MTKKELPTEIKSQRISLRKHQLEIAETMFKCVDQNRERLGKFLPWVEKTVSVQDEVNFINSVHKAWDEGSLYGYSIFENESDTFIGGIGLHNVRWEHDRCEIGYWIAGDFEGKGYITEAVGLLEKVLFDAGFNRIEIRCDGNNDRSANVPKRSGYVLEGKLREDCFVMNQHRNTLVFAKLRSDLPKLPVELDGYQIREANITKDTDALFKLNQIISPDEDWPRFYEDVSKLKGKIFVVEANATIIGFLTMSFPYWNDIGVFFHFAVLEPYRRKGIGTKLMEHALNVAEKNSLNFVTIRTALWNWKTIDLYKKLGFKPTGIFADYFGTDNDMVWLEKKLTHTQSH